MLGYLAPRLEHYNPLAQNPERWQQCLRCLQVAHISITEDDWWAHFQTANQNTTATRQTILNTTIRNFSTKALWRVDANRARAWDQIISLVISTNPLPFDADPHITEWIECEAACLRTNAEKHAFACAKQKAVVLHEQQKAIIQSCLEADLTLLHNKADKALDVTWERARQELVDLHSEHKAQCEALKAGL
jgi:hypothetical protein